MDHDAPHNQGDRYAPPSQVPGSQNCYASFPPLSPALFAVLERKQLPFVISARVDISGIMPRLYSGSEKPKLKLAACSNPSGAMQVPAILTWGPLFDIQGVIGLAAYWIPARGSF